MKQKVIVTESVSRKVLLENIDYKFDGGYFVHLRDPPYPLVDIIIKDIESLLNNATNKEVTRLLTTVTGERGDSEGAVDVVKRLIKESR